MLTIDNKEIRVFCKNCGEELSNQCKIDEVQENRILVEPCESCDNQEIIQNLENELEELKIYCNHLLEKLEDYE